MVEPPFRQIAEFVMVCPIYRGQGLRICGKQGKKIAQALEDIAMMLKQTEETRAHLRRQWLLSSRRQAIVHEWRSASLMTTQLPDP